MGQGSDIVDARTDKDKAVVWTGQGSIVADTLKQTGRYIVKSRYVDQKYRDTAWIFQEAYRFLMERSRDYMPRAEGAESPIWVYTDPVNIPKDSDTHLWRLEVPRAQILLFDTRKWNKILNLSYIGDNRGEEEEFDRWLRRRGVRDPLDVFATSHYPLEKAEVKKSWRKLFLDEKVEPVYEQGMIWELRTEWVTEDLDRG